MMIYDNLIWAILVQGKTNSTLKGRPVCLRVKRFISPAKFPFSLKIPPTSMMMTHL